MATYSRGTVRRVIQEKFPEQAKVVKEDIKALQEDDLEALKEDLFGEIKSLIDHFGVVGQKLKQYYKQFTTVQKEDSHGTAS